MVVDPWAGPQSRRLLFRTYATVVGGLLLVAAVFDFGLSRFYAGDEAEELAWIEGNLTLIESQLKSLPAHRWTEEVERLERVLGFPVNVLPSDHFVQPGAVKAGTQALFDAEGRAAYFRRSETLGAGIQIGPLSHASSTDELWPRLVPTLFYVAIAVVASLWLWPLLRDLNLLTAAARAFASDYRQPMRTRDKTRTLTELATSFDEMSERIRGLIQNQKELTSALSHEVRTPLARIKFAVAMAGDRCNAELASIGQDVDEIDRLITTMLDYARLDHPRVTVNHQATPIGVWIERILARHRAGLDDTLSLRAELRDEAALVTMDPYLMELALNNLIVNAARYARSTVVVRFNVEGDEYVLAVEDDGPGIPLADRETIFKPFTRLDHSRNRQTGGYGLGLAIVARIVARHGGRASAHGSAVGGARFEMRWPVVEPRPARA